MLEYQDFDKKRHEIKEKEYQYFEMKAKVEGLRQELGWCIVKFEELYGQVNYFDDMKREFSMPKKNIKKKRKTFNPSEAMTAFVFIINILNIIIWYAIYARIV